MHPISDDADVDAALAANPAMATADKQALAQAIAGIEDLRPRITEHQREQMGDFADAIASKIIRIARQAIRIGAGLDSLDQVVRQLENGEIIHGIMRDGFDGSIPPEAACAAGCFFCCVVVDRITATEAEIARVHHRIAGMPAPDFHPDACPSLDPETRACRAYDVRPMVCRDVYATRLDPCRTSYQIGRIAPEAEFMQSGGHLYFYAVNWLLIALGRRELLKTYDLKASLRAGGDLIPLPPA